MSLQLFLRGLVVFICCGALRVAAQNTHTVFTEARVNGWQSWDWVTVNYAATAYAHSGSRSMSAVLKNSEAIYLHHDTLRTTPYQAVRLWLHGGTTGGQKLQLRALRKTKEQKAFALPELKKEQWTEVVVSLAELEVADVDDFDGLWIQNIAGGSQGTFYVDDIELTFAPAPAVVNLTVNTQQVVRTLDPRFYGVNLTMWDSLLTAPETASLLSGIKQGSLRIPGGSLSDDYDWHTNKQVSTNPNWTWTNSIATFATFVEQQSASQVYVVVNYGSGTPEQAAAWVAYYNGDPASTRVLGVDSKGRDWKTVGYWAGIRAANKLASDDGLNFLRLSHPAPFGFKYWEVGNECYGSWEYDQHGVAGSGLTGAKNDPYTYGSEFKRFYDQMLAVDPTIKIGAVGVLTEEEYGIKTNAVMNPRTGVSYTSWMPVMLSRLKALGVAPHFLIQHYYAQNPTNESDHVLLQKGPELQKHAQNSRQMLTDYLGTAAAAGVEIVLTELNSVSLDPGKQSANLVNALFYADAYAALAQSEFNTVLWWDLHNSAHAGNNNASELYGWRMFGCYDMIAGTDFPGVPVHTPLPTYYGAKLMTHWARGGDALVSGSSDYSWLSVYPAKLADGRLALLVINKHPTADLMGRLQINGMAVASTATIRSYGKSNDAKGSSQPDLSVGTINNVSTLFDHIFPSYSASVIELASSSNPPPPPPSGSDAARIINLSARAVAGTDAKTLIVGFVLSSGAGTKPLVIRGVGPTLGTLFDLPGTLTDPKLTLFSQAGAVLDTNDNWGGDATLLTKMSQVGAFPYTNGATKDAALFVSLSPGVPYTAHVTSSAGSGVALAEFYDASTAFAEDTPRLINISARADVGKGGNVLIVGFVIAGNGSRTVVLRGVGPGLTSTFGLQGALADPKIQLFNRDSVVIKENDNWGADGTTAQLQAAMSSVGAFSLVAGSKDAVLVVTLEPGNYTAIVSGVNDTVGVGLAEVYEMK